jgi:hypothetical protein
MTTTPTGQNFSDLSFDDKKIRLKVMLDQLKNSDEIFGKILTVITTKNVTEDYLDKVYADIMNFATALQSYSKNKDQAQLTKAQTALQSLYALEAESRKQDEIDIKAIEASFAA